MTTCTGELIISFDGKYKQKRGKYKYKYKQSKCLCSIEDGFSFKDLAITNLQICAKSDKQSIRIR